MSKKPKNPVSDKQEHHMDPSSRSSRVSRGGYRAYYPYKLQLLGRNFSTPNFPPADRSFRIVKNIPKDPKEEKNE